MMTANQFASPASRWTALTTRNPLAANSFIYSVVTTKIYCRPTCPSRLARRANIVFHDSPAEAEADGFRACMRCKPGTLSGEEGDPQRIAVEKVKQILRSEEGDARWSVKQLAKEVGLTESHFCRTFKKLEGMTIGKFKAQARNNLATRKYAIREHPIQIAEALFQFDIEEQSLDYTPFTTFDDLNGIDVLAKEWHDFSGPQPGTARDLFPGMFDFINFDIDFGCTENLTPGLLSDRSSPSRTTTDDSPLFGGSPRQSG
jgi:methylphosphotriester-DNA--protein-cysteine methyltransferase